MSKQGSRLSIDLAENCHLLLKIKCGKCRSNDLYSYIQNKLDRWFTKFGLKKVLKDLGREWRGKLRFLKLQKMSLYFILLHDNFIAATLVYSCVMHRLHDSYQYAWKSFSVKTTLDKQATRFRVFCIMKYVNSLDISWTKRKEW